MRAHDTFVAQGVPVVFGEYGVLGYDHGPDGLVRGEMLKYFEAFGNSARTNGVSSFLWDNGAFFDLVFVPLSGSVPDRTLTLNRTAPPSRGSRQAAPR